MNLNTVKKIIPLFKYCYGKNELVEVLRCDCVNKCNMEYLIPHHKPRKLHFYTNLRCDITNNNQRIGNCLCIDKCSASMNDLQSYEFTSLNVNNPN